MSFWAVTFLEYWKRRNATLAHHWDCMDFQEEEASVLSPTPFPLALPTGEAKPAGRRPFLLLLCHLEPSHRTQD